MTEFEKIIIYYIQGVEVSRKEYVKEHVRLSKYAGHPIEKKWIVDNCFHVDIQDYDVEVDKLFTRKEWPLDRSCDD